MMKERSEIKKLNWSTELSQYDDEEKVKILTKVREAERKLVKEQNCKWVKLSPTFRILIPFDKETNEPTESGMKKIRQYKEMLNIV